MPNCHWCHQKIFFDEKHKSKHGRFIPLDPGNKPHNCPNKPKTKRAWAREKSFYGHTGMPFVNIEDV